MSGQSVEVLSGALQSLRAQDRVGASELSLKDDLREECRDLLVELGQRYSLDPSHPE